MMYTPPRLVWVMGPACAGKRTFSKKLVRKINNIVRLDKDILQNALCGDDRSSGVYDYYYREQSYDALWDLAIDNINDGRSALIHSPNIEFYRNDTIGYTKKKIQNVDVLFKLIYCIAPEEEIKRRMILRGYHRDKSKYETDKSWRNYVISEPQFNQPPLPHLMIDTSKNECDNIELALEFLE